MKLKLLFPILMLCAATLAAQSPAKILKQAERAMGGTRSLRSALSWQKRGTIKRLGDGASGKFLLQATAPNLYNMTFDIAGFEIESGYNGKSAWARDSRSGLATLTGKSSSDLQAEAAFRTSLWLDAKKEKSRITRGGKSEVAGRPANVLIVNTAKGATIKLFFDATTSLLLREEFSADDSRRSFEYTDFRPVGGLNHAHTIKMELGGVGYEVALDEIKSNVQIARTEFDFPNISGEPLPDIPSLLKAVQANEDKVDGILDTYSYIQRHIRREMGKDGVLREAGSEAYQLSFYKGYRIARMIEKDGKPLSADDQNDQDRNAGKRVDEIEKLIAKQERRAVAGEPAEENRRISIAELFRASTLSNPRRERFRGRDVIVFDFEPNPSFDYKNAKSMLKFFGKTGGAMWIDEEDKQVARLEAFLLDSYNIGGGILAKLKKGASFTLEQERVNDEIWLPSTADINLSVRVFLVKGIDLNQVIRTYDYRKFTTEVKDARVDPVDQK